MADGPGGRFTKGHKYAKGGKRVGAGMKSKQQLADLALQRERINQRLAADADYHYDNYRRFAEVDPATARHAIDKFVPPVEKHEHSGEVGVRPWGMDAYQPKKKEKK